MYFRPYVYAQELENPVFVTISEATPADLKATCSWQSSWETEYLQRPGIDKYALKLGNEIIALGAYTISGNRAYAYIVYLESAPSSNPVLRISHRVNIMVSAG